MALVPYVTFLPINIEKITRFIDTLYPSRNNSTFETNCMWVKSPVSPIVEIENLSPQTLENVKYAVLISTPGSVNKSLLSLKETIEGKNLEVVIVSSLGEFLTFEKRYKKEKVLLVRSPIPNEAEHDIMNYIDHEKGNSYE